MGALMSLLGLENTTTDPITGLNNKEVRLIKSSYAKVMEQPIENGMLIMGKLFEKNPKYKQLFPFKAIPDDELKNDVSFKVHCNRIMYNLKEVVDNLSDGELVQGMLDKLAGNHKKHGAPGQGFHDIEVVILEILGSLFSSETSQAWQKLLGMAMGHIAQQLS